MPDAADWPIAYLGPIAIIMLMIILTHVIIAFTSLVIASYSFFKPAASVIKLSYGLIAATAVSGFYLVFSYPSHMLQSCAVGLAYVASVSVLSIYAHRKFAIEQVNNYK